MVYVQTNITRAGAYLLVDQTIKLSWHHDLP